MIPLYILWDSKLPKAPRYMIRVVFATSLSITTISAVEDVYAQGPYRNLQGYIIHFEVRVLSVVS